jgi:hypothetical protein
MAVVSCRVPCGQVEDVLVSDGPVTWPLSRHMDTHSTQCAYDVHAAVSPVYLSRSLYLPSILSMRWWSVAVQSRF